MITVYAYPKLTTYAWYGGSMPADILIRDAFKSLLQSVILSFIDWKEFETLRLKVRLKLAPNGL